MDNHGVVETGLFVRPVGDPGHRGDPGLIQPVVSQGNHVQTLALVKNCL